MKYSCNTKNLQIKRYCDNINKEIFKGGLEMSDKRGWPTNEFSALSAQYRAREIAFYSNRSDVARREIKKFDEANSTEEKRKIIQDLAIENHFTFIFGGKCFAHIDAKKIESGKFSDNDHGLIFPNKESDQAILYKDIKMSIGSHPIANTPIIIIRHK